jgi:hypothetical protein
MCMATAQPDSKSSVRVPSVERWCSWAAGYSIPDGRSESNSPAYANSPCSRQTDLCELQGTGLPVPSPCSRPRAAATYLVSRRSWLVKIINRRSSIINRKSSARRTVSLPLPPHCPGGVPIPAARIAAVCVTDDIRIGVGRRSPERSTSETLASPAGAWPAGGRHISRPLSPPAGGVRACTSPSAAGSRRGTGLVLSLSHTGGRVSPRRHTAATADARSAPKHSFSLPSSDEGRHGGRVLPFVYSRRLGRRWYIVARDSYLAARCRLGRNMTHG